MFTQSTGLFFWRLYFGPGTLALKFLHALLSPINCISNRTWGAGRPEVGLCPIFLVITVTTIIFMTETEVRLKLFINTAVSSMAISLNYN